MKILLYGINSKIAWNVSITRLNTKYVCVHNVNDTDFFSTNPADFSSFYVNLKINMREILNIP